MLSGPERHIVRKSFSYSSDLQVFTSITTVSFTDSLEPTRLRSNMFPKDGVSEIRSMRRGSVNPVWVYPKQYTTEYSVHKYIYGKRIQHNTSPPLVSGLEYIVS